MTLTKLNGNESGVIIAKLINALIDEKASIDLSDLDATGEQRFTDLSTAISTLNTALSTLTTTVNKKVEATVSLAANGYIKFDNGVLLQWFDCNILSGKKTGTTTLPTSYTQFYKGFPIHSSLDGNLVLGTSTANNSSFSIRANDVTNGYHCHCFTIGI